MSRFLLVCHWILLVVKLSLLQAALEVIEEPEAQLWWAAKELKRTNQLSDYVGKNEKTKIIIKIQKVSICDFPSKVRVFI